MHNYNSSVCMVINMSVLLRFLFCSYILEHEHYLRGLFVSITISEYLTLIGSQTELKNGGK